MTKLYIAYGSNMDEKQMAYRCPEAQLLGTAEVEDYRLLFKGSKTGAYATIEPQKGNRVPVLLWEITEQDERNLDRYEGYPRFYYKKDLEIEFGGERKTAMVYIMHEENPLGIPSQRYQEVISNAYRKFGFDSTILEKALAESSIQKR
ncbi:gamma-glutamylcyclotransferase family protein [Frisingicoccus sp.]|uniref:gamma-glutamylcyclotransferase family protein n=1 Tax=Frisingicoccus sp. TaxID=1918627 RepID=UPI003AB8196A